jgi:hypothetical protein
LQREFDERYAEEKKQLDAMGGNGGSVGDGTSTGMVSSTGTPAATDTPHIRLKVKSHATSTPDRADSPEDSD